MGPALVILGAGGLLRLLAPFASLVLPALGLSHARSQVWGGPSWV
jgi:hypothetical protein